jgi:putative transposase
MVADMARRLRVDYKGAIHHVTVRGVAQQAIFRDDSDRRRFLKRLGDGVAECGVRVYLFCLMPNHAHLLVETPRANLSTFMHKLQTAYTVYFNLRHQRAGHLMQGRFGDVLVENGAHLLKLSRYVHLNPVNVEGLNALAPEERTRALRKYEWSSYQGYAGLAKPFAFVDEGPVLAAMEPHRTNQERAYRRYVETGIAKTDEELHAMLTTCRWGIGGQDFVDRARSLHTHKAMCVRRQEDVSFRRTEDHLSADTVLRAVARTFAVDDARLRRRQYGCVPRAVAALMLSRHAGMNQRDIGTFLNMGTGSAVCRQLSRLRNALEQDAGLNRCVAELHSTLHQRTTSLPTSTNLNCQGLTLGD